MTSPTWPSVQPVQSQALHELLHTVPAPLVTILAGLGLYITPIRRILEIVSWKVSKTTSWSDSWLVVALWWAICLGTSPILRYALPALVALSLAYRIWRPPTPRTVRPPVSETTLQDTITDLNIINALIPRPANLEPDSVTMNTTPLFPPLTGLQLLRLAVSLTMPYLILTYFVRLRIILGIFGTVILTWRASFTIQLRHTIASSAHVRWATYQIWSKLSGQPLPSTLSSSSLKSTVAMSPSSVKEEAVPPPRFLFTVYENQRWWMGLDWTAALLPAERPSWCSPSLTPILPPAAFSLPPPTIAYFPSTINHNGRTMRTATWGWAEPEWRVIIRKEGSTGSSRIERAPPAPEDPAHPSSTAAGIASSGSRLFAKIREGSISEKAPPVPTAGSAESIKRLRSSSRERTKVDEKKDDNTHEQALAKQTVDEPLTDADGWIYGDNKWEGQSAKGGMGKYTRYRRWTRIAVLTESVEEVGPGELGIEKPHPDTPPLPISQPASPSAPRRSLDEPNLRQRLKLAVKGTV